MTAVIIYSCKVAWKCFSFYILEHIKLIAVNAAHKKLFSYEEPIILQNKSFILNTLSDHVLYILH